MKMRKQGTVLLAVLILPLFFGTGSALATSGYVADFITAYPASQSANASCQLCHAAQTAYLNAYGRAFAANNDSFSAIAQQNSDNDPTNATNLAEINANTQPGWTPGPNNTLYDRNNLAVYATNQNPPSIAGNLDPVAAPVNQGPTLNAPGNQTVNVGQNLTITLSATDADRDALTFSFGSTPPAGMTLTPGTTYGTATLAWTPPTSGNFPVTVTVQDAGGASDPQTFTITVGPAVNHPPVLGHISNARVRAGQTLQFTVTAADPDGDQLVFSPTGLPAGATLVDNGNGTATFLWTPPAGTAGGFPVTITVTDMVGLTDSQTFTITVRARRQRK